MSKRNDIPHAELRTRLQKLGLYGLLMRCEEIAQKPWLDELLAIEEAERQRRSLQRRLRYGRVGTFKPISDFDWTWPKKLDRQALDELFGLQFVEDGTNVVLLGPNGVGKTMLLRNISHHAILRGHTVRFTTASDMLADLAAQDSSTSLARGLRRYTLPKLLCVDEVGYLSYDNRYADLLFEVVTRRYESNKAILVSTNKPFAEWSDVFPHAACVVTLVDRLIHRCEVIEIQGDSYRLKEAKEHAVSRSARRKRSSK